MLERAPLASPPARAPAARVIDCVLSLRRNYDGVVAPRVREFVARFPQTRSCQAMARATGLTRPTVYAYLPIRP